MGFVATLRQFFIVTLVVTSLVSCSGGGLDSDTNQPDPAVLVNAGPNASVNENVTVTLTGTASSTTGSTLTYAWSASPVLTITQSSDTSPTATFITPTAVEVLTYTFTLVVTDAEGNQATDSVIYTINPVNESPNALISVTQPDNATDNSYPAGIEIILDGSTSNDPDATDNLNPIATWQWQQTAGTDVLQNVSLNGDSIAFTTPILDAPSTLSFELTVTDQEGATDVNSISLNILSASQTLPTVNAGVDHQVYPGEIILLNGQAGSSIPAAQPLVFQWLNDSELTPAIQQASTLQTYAIAPMVNQSQLVTFTLNVTDAFGNKVDDSVSIRIKPRPLAMLNDTGVTQQATDVTVGNAFQADFPGQDGQKGLDIISANDLFEKAGRGAAGFDFTRLDAIGDEQDDINQPWSCVRDNTTGLVWEVKVNDGSLHSTEHSYSWYQEENNGGFNGVLGNAGLSCSIAQCDTSAYIAAVNAAGLCNFYDWRLPNYNELLSLMHFGVTDQARIDLEYFPNTDDGSSSTLWYWTSQPNADGVADDAAQNAWAIDYLSGNDNFLNKATNAKIRLVRGGR